MEELKQKAELRAKRAEEKRKKECTRKTRKQKTTCLDLEPDVGTSSETKGTDNHPRCKRIRLATDSDKEVDSSQCCVCFVTYEDDVIEENGRSWIECSCGRWLHEDCSIVSPSMPMEFCPFCVR